MGLGLKLVTKKKKKGVQIIAQPSSWPKSLGVNFFFQVRSLDLPTSIGFRIIIPVPTVHDVRKLYMYRVIVLADLPDINASQLRCTCAVT